MASILVLEVKGMPQAEIKEFKLVCHAKLVENDTSFVLFVYLAPEILHF